MKKSPAFQFYPADFLVGTADMTCEEVGIYMRLLCFQWDRGGLPNSDKSLRVLVGSRRPIPLVVLSKFGICSDGLLRNNRLSQEKEKQVRYSSSRADNARKRWDEESIQKDAHASIVHCTEDALQTSSVVSKETTIEKKTRKKREQPPPDDAWLDELSSSPAYLHLNVRAIYSRSEWWCKTNNRKLTRPFFINWLGRELKTNRNERYSPPAEEASYTSSEPDFDIMGEMRKTRDRRLRMESIMAGEIKPETEEEMSWVS